MKIPQHFWNLKFQLDVAKLRKDGGRGGKLEKKGSESYTISFPLLIFRKAADIEIETQKISETKPPQAKGLRSIFCPGIQLGMTCSPSLKVPREGSRDLRALWLMLKG